MQPLLRKGHGNDKAADIVSAVFRQNGDIEIAVRKHFGDLRRGRLAEIKLYLRIRLAEALYVFGKPLRAARPVVPSDVQLILSLGGETARSPLKNGKLGVVLNAPLHEALASPCEADGRGAAVEQPAAKRLFKGLDVSADGLLRAVELLGGNGEISSPCYRQKTDDLHIVHTSPLQTA